MGSLLKQRRPVRSRLHTSTSVPSLQPHVSTTQVGTIPVRSSATYKRSASTALAGTHTMWLTTLTLAYNFLRMSTSHSCCSGNTTMLILLSDEVKQLTFVMSTRNCWNVVCRRDRPYTSRAPWYQKKSLPCAISATFRRQLQH